MADYTACVRWCRREDEEYLDNQYSRGHEWHFDGGVTVPASASPHIVPPPASVEANVDPEEAFVAALSSCHMLFFLSVAAQRRFVVDEYVDDAIGSMARDTQGRWFVNRVVLRPHVRFAPDRKPDAATLEAMHHRAHELCFIANSVRTEVVTEIRD